MTTRLTNAPNAAPSRGTAVRLNKGLYWLCRRWFLVLTILLGLYIGLPWLAPVFSALGWWPAADAIYLVYSTQCHQLPQRSFFLFGDVTMVPLATVQAQWSNSADPLVLRQFIGDEAIGWKVAWSDRMVYMYSSLFVFGLLFWPLRQRLKPLSLTGFVLLLAPLAIDGVTHLVSDILGGIGGGFRDTNVWLATLTNQRFPATFYAGDGLGSFNAWLRFITGVLFGLGVVWFCYPQLRVAFHDVAHQIERKFQARDDHSAGRPAEHRNAGRK